MVWQYMGKSHGTHFIAIASPKQAAPHSGKGSEMSARYYKRMFIIIAAVVAIFLAYQQIPHIYIGERAQGSYEGGIASEKNVSNAIKEAQEAADEAGHAGPEENGK